MMDNRILDDRFFREPKELDNKIITKINLLKLDINEEIGHIIHARTTLFVLSALVVLASGILLVSGGDEALYIDIAIEAVLLLTIYLSCAYFIGKNPKVFILIGLCTYILFIILYTFIDISTLYRGIIIKLAIIFFLIRGVRDAFAIEKGVGKLKAIGVNPDEFENIKKLKSLPLTPKNLVSIESEI